jgi:hypothetical protein
MNLAQRTSRGPLTLCPESQLSRHTHRAEKMSFTATMLPVVYMLARPVIAPVLIRAVEEIAWLAMRRLHCRCEPQFEQGACHLKCSEAISRESTTLDTHPPNQALPPTVMAPVA